MRKVKSAKKHKQIKHFKKSVFGLMMAVLCFIPIMLYVFAGEKSTITLGAISSASKGETVNVPITLELADDVEQYQLLSFILEYDPDAFEIDISATKKSLNGAFDIKNVEVEEDGKLSVSLLNSEPLSESGDMGSVVMKILDKASGSYDLTISNEKLVYANEETSEETNFDVTSNNGSIFVNVPLESVSLEKTAFDFDLGATDNKTADILVNYLPADTTDAKNYSFVSNNTDIVTVDDNGKITAVGNGETTITVSAFGQEFTVDVNVETHINSISLSDTTLKLEKGGNKTLSATINPTNTTDSTVITWESSDSDYVSVDSDGKVVGIKATTEPVTITAKTSNGKVATCNVTVVISVKDANFTANSNKTYDFNLDKGASKTLEVTLDPIDTTDEIVWSTSNKDVATVDADGIVTAIKGGDVTITGKIGNITLTSDIKVIVPVESISLAKNSIEMLPNQTDNSLVNPTVLPADAYDKNVTWESSNKEVATVDTTGKITAISAGTTIITATTSNGKKAECTVKVLIPIDNVVINQSEVTLEKGKTTTLTVTVSPDNAEEDKTVTWTSGDKAIATVDNNGKVTALKGGNVTITGTLKNGKTVTSNIKVVVPATMIDMKDKTTINKGETFELNAVVTPSDTTDSIIYESSDKNIATVNEDGVVEAISAGTVIITATAGSVSKDCTVTVVVPVKSISLNVSSKKINNGETFNLIATIDPTDATNQKITWKSSNEKVAEVNDAGVVTGISKGTATITAEVDGKKATATIEVYVPIDSFELDKEQEQFELVKGKSLTLKTTINPDASLVSDSTTITWTSSNVDVATVDNNGKVTAISEGTTKIIGKLENGMTVESNVTVTIIPVKDISFSDVEDNILKNDTIKLVVKPNPIDTTEMKKIIWASSDETIATVDENGNVKALKAGKVTITATMGTFKIEKEITIKEVHLESLDVSDNKSKISIGEEYNLNVIFNPKNTTDDITLTYKSSDESVVKVDENGKVTGVKAGKATITVIASNGIETTLDIEVEAINSPKTGVTPISIFTGLSLMLLVGIGFILKKKVSLR